MLNVETREQNFSTSNLHQYLTFNSFDYRNLLSQFDNVCSHNFDGSFRCFVLQGLQRLIDLFGMLQRARLIIGTSVIDELKIVPLYIPGTSTDEINVHRCNLGLQIT